MMKKIIALLLCLAVAVLVGGPALTIADTQVSTSFTRSDLGGARPIIKVKWEMYGPYSKLTGADASTASGAQFLPSGQYNVGRTIAICGIATDPDGMADIDSVYGDVYYPEKIWTGPNHDPSQGGCGKMVGTECRMTRLEKMVGYNLFCETIRTKNSNLPKWYDAYDFAEVCASDGELMKETAYVFCCDKTLSYEDPSGDYRTLVFAQDKNAVDSNYLENYFRYLDLTAFEVDFTSVNYGDVKLNTHKVINGDLTFGTGNLPTVRNVGNTRLQMSVWEDDMGLGKTGTDWNVKYDARVGSDAGWKNYWPQSVVWLNNPLNLSETDEMDFSIDVFKFPPGTNRNFTGALTLGAQKVSHLECPGD